MNLFDLGSGPPVVLIPGVQGRWEWMRPGVEALARRCRVITFSLARPPAVDERSEVPAGLSYYVNQVREVMDAANLERAAICGVSYGGLVATAFAVVHPDRVASLVLVSAIPPSWTPDRRVRFYLGAPRLLTPVFCVASLRLYREIAAASPSFTSAVVAALRHVWRVLTHPFSPASMAQRIRMLAAQDVTTDLQRLHLPTLVVTGDDALDRVVPPWRTREYMRLWPHARQATIARTGHLGIITRPLEFARVVASFVEATATTPTSGAASTMPSVQRAATDDTRRRVG